MVYNNKTDKIYDVFLCLLICSFFITIKTFSISIGGFTLFLDRIFLILISVLFLFKIIGNRKKMIETSNVFLCLITFYAFYVFFSSFYNGNSSNDLKRLIFYIEILLIFHIISVSKNTKFLNRILVVLLNISCIIGFLQMFGIDVFKSSLLYNLPKSYDQMQYINMIFYRGTLTRLTSFFTHSLAYGSILSIAIPYLVFLYKNKVINSFVFYITISMCVVNLWYTYSRIPIFMVIVYFIILFIIQVKKGNRSYLKKVMYFILALTIFSLIFGFFIKNIGALMPDGSFNQDISIEQRFKDYKQVLNEFQNKPLLGYGSGAYFQNTGQAVDNYFLTILYENGILAVISFVIFFISIYLFIKNKRSGQFSILFIFVQVVIYNVTFDAFAFWEFAKFYFIILALSQLDYKGKIT